MFKKKNIQKEILDYIYEIQNQEIIQTYKVVQNENIEIIPVQVFYYDILGEKTIEKLINRGYISIEEAKQKYEDISIVKNIKTKKRH